jgi:hypothetical protein
VLRPRNVADGGIGRSESGRSEDAAMYLVVDPLTQFYIFTEIDPREDGYEGPVETDVRLDGIGTWEEATGTATTAVPCLGHSPDNAKHFRVFYSMRECRQAGFVPTSSVYGKYRTWHEFHEDPL